MSCVISMRRREGEMEGWREKLLKNRWKRKEKQSGRNKKEKCNRINFNLSCIRNLFNTYYNFHLVKFLFK